VRCVALGLHAAAGRAPQARQEHDHLFKLACSTPEAALAVVRAGLSEAVARGIDPGSLRVEPPSFLTGEPLSEDFRDVVLSCRLRGRPALIYVVIEHQRRVDPAMPLRIAVYVQRMWAWWRTEHPGEPLPVVLPIVVHQGPGPWTGPRSIADMLDAEPAVLDEVRPFMPGLELALLAAPAFLRISLTLMRVVVIPGVSPEQILQVLRVDLAAPVRELIAQPGGAERLGNAISYTVRRVKGLDMDAVREAAREAAGAKADEVVMSTAQELIDQGVQQGERNILERLLRKRFGALPAAIRERLDAASGAQIKTWSERVLSAKRVDDVFAAPKTAKGKKPGSGRAKR
jgi:hypothetical protein